MGDIINIEGVKLDELPVVSTINDEAIFLVGVDKNCRIMSMRSLRTSFAGNPDSTDKDSVYYTATYIDNKFTTVENSITNINTNLTQLSNQVTTEIQNLNSRFDTLSTTLTDKVNTQINDAIRTMTNTINGMITDVNNKITEIDNMKDTLVTKSTKKTATLQAASWTGTEDNLPFTNTISVNGVSATNNVEVVLPANATPTQVEAWCEAAVVHGAQADNSITLKGYGTIPEIDIPIEVIIRTDI